MDVELLYAASVIVIILILLIVAQYSYTKRVIPRHHNIPYNIMIDTPNGLIKSTNNNAADILEKIRHKLYNRRHLIASDCNKLKPLIDANMRDLEIFIKNNPSNGLCRAEYSADHISDLWTQSIAPGEDWRYKFKSIVDWQDKDTKIEYLFRNLDVAIALLRGDVCEYGRVNIKRLYKLLLAINKQSCIYDSKSFDNERNGVVLPNKRLPISMGRDSNNKLGTERHKSRYHDDAFEQLSHNSHTTSHRYTSNPNTTKPRRQIASVDAINDITTCVGKTASDGELWRQCVAVTSLI